MGEAVAGWGWPQWLFLFLCAGVLAEAAGRWVTLGWSVTRPILIGIAIVNVILVFGGFWT